MWSLLGKAGSARSPEPGPVILEVYENYPVKKLQYKNKIVNRSKFVLKWNCFPSRRPLFSYYYIKWIKLIKKKKNDKTEFRLFFHSMIVSVESISILININLGHNERKLKMWIWHSLILLWLSNLLIHVNSTRFSSFTNSTSHLFDSVLY